MVRANGRLGRTPEKTNYSKWLAPWLLILGAGCNGFPHPVPIADAQNRPEKYPGYAAKNEPVFTLDGQQWQVLPGAVVQAPPAALQPVNGGRLYVVRGQRPPFSTLFAQLPDSTLVKAGALY